MNNDGVLLISRSPLFTEAIQQLLQAGNIKIAATVHAVEDVWPLLQSHSITKVVAEFDDVGLNEGAIIAQLCRRDRSQRVILLTLNGNSMIVHRREYVDNVTSSDLIMALQETSTSGIC